LQNVTAAAFALAFVVLPGELSRAAGLADFDGEIAPILARRCLGCHSGAEPKGGLDLSRRESALRGGDSGEAIRPGQPDESLLWENVSGGLMPPKSRLPAREAAVLRDWIASGAIWGTDPIDRDRFSTNTRAGRDWWAFRQVLRPRVPHMSQADWVEDPIDAFILEGLERAGLHPSPRADRRTLVRRLAFDLTGLPPSPQEVEAFISDDRTDAYERLADRLLASPQYGVRWARLWLDLARYGESNGFEHDEFRPDAWRYRDWVVGALNRDLPYDEFARIQLAGDVLRPDDPGAVEATGFLVAGAYDSVGQEQQSEAMKRVVRQDELEDAIGTVGQTFLGLTPHCARCHDHKFDPIGQVEYYRLAAALAGIRHGVRDLTALDPDARTVERALKGLLDQRAALEAPARERLLAGHTGSVAGAPAPLARWEFARGPEDRLGSLNGTFLGGARPGREGLELDGAKGYLVSAPLQRDLVAKTIEAWVRLADLRQRGGGVMGVQDGEGGAFDAIAYAEREPGRWMAGSDNFRRTRDLGVPAESEADRRFVHVTVTYAEDGTISVYREGRPYGTPYNPGPPVHFRAGQARVLVGMRHGPPGGNRMLAGVVAEARLYDRALTPDEVAASFAAGGPVPEDALAAALTPEARERRSKVLEAIEARRSALARLVRRAYVVVPRPPGPTHRLLRGDAGRPAEVVAAGGIAALAGLEPNFGLAPDAPETDRRVRLAAWITDRRNPLFARVIVNRLWQAHFGVGLVETPSDFGFNGGRPSHPELLDWLASELVAGGWSLKHVHRLIVTSAAYRQASLPDAAGARVDASNRLVWRRAPMRLEAEAVRDAMLAVSGALDLRTGGPGFREFAVVKAEGTTTNQYRPIDASGPEFDRRTLFRTWARGGRSGFLDAFDCPDPSTTAPRRTSTTTPLQALALLNDALTLSLADRFAERLRREAGDDAERQVKRAYALAFGRPPDPEECRRATHVAQNHGPAVLARAIFNSSEFLYID
jgi:hypothetical protein